MPFSFEFFGVPYHDFSLQLSYGAGVGISGVVPDNNLKSGGINPTDVAVVDRGIAIGEHLSPILFKVTGEAPNRVAHFEIKNAGAAVEVLYGDNIPQAEGESYFNFQMRLFELDHVIEVHYGPRFLHPRTIPHFLNGSRFNAPISHLYSNSKPYPAALQADSIVIVYGDFQSPKLKRITTQNFIQQDGFDTLQLSQLPPDGYVYRYAPVVSSAVRDAGGAVATARVAPNPASDYLTVTHDEHPLGHTLRLYSLTIVDALGREVLTTPYRPGDPLDISDLALGAYWLKLQLDGDIATARFLKQ